eukprot:1891815-Rhodomonas_salina.1
MLCSSDGIDESRESAVVASGEFEEDSLFGGPFGRDTVWLPVSSEGGRGEVALAHGGFGQDGP